MITINHVKIGTYSILQNKPKKICTIYQKSHINSNKYVSTLPRVKPAFCMFRINSLPPVLWQRLFPCKVAIYFTPAPRGAVSETHNQLCSYLHANDIAKSPRDRCLQWSRLVARNDFLLENWLWPLQSNCKLESLSKNSVVKDC
jgi:hypothetical protein